MRPLIASDYTQLAFHALAHVRLPAPANLFDSKYVRWAERHLPPDAVAPVLEDARLISGNAELTLQLAPELFEDLVQLRRSARLDVSELSPVDVRSPAALREWRRARGPGPELLRVALSLGAGAFEHAWPDVRARCQAAIETHAEVFAHAAALQPALRDVRVELAFALGSRGRAFRRRLVVGVPGDGWSGESSWIPAIVAMHEHAVRAANEGYERAEWRALVDVARRMEGAQSEMRECHRAWLARFDLDRVLERAVRDGALTEADARTMAEHPEERAARLARTRS